MAAAQSVAEQSAVGAPTVPDNPPDGPGYVDDSNINFTDDNLMFDTSGEDLSQQSLYQPRSELENPSIPDSVPQDQDVGVSSEVPSSDQEGVLSWLEQTLAGQSPFAVKLQEDVGGFLHALLSLINI